LILCTVPKTHFALLDFLLYSKGGGVFRARLAASANQTVSSSSINDPNSDLASEHPQPTPLSFFSFPVVGEHHNVLPKMGPLIDSHFANFRPCHNASFPQEIAEEYDTYEGTLPCAAETPLGQAIACPLLKRSVASAIKKACHATECHVAYVGHNYLGSELHWLPDAWLAKWWRETTWHKHRNEARVLSPSPAATRRRKLADLSRDDDEEENGSNDANESKNDVDENVGNDHDANESKNVDIDNVGNDHDAMNSKSDDVGNDRDAYVIDNNDQAAVQLVSPPTEPSKKSLGRSGLDEEKDNSHEGNRSRKYGNDENDDKDTTGSINNDMYTIHDNDLAQALDTRMMDWLKSERISKCYLPPQDKALSPGRAKIDEFRHYKRYYSKCVHPKEAVLDQVASRLVATTADADNGQGGDATDWSSVYASMPVLRTVMLREPLSWLVSKFFWRSFNPGYQLGMSGTKYYNLSTCDNSHIATTTSLEERLRPVADWVSLASRTYIYALCGEDCAARMQHGTMTLHQVETQARHNLQQSFAVVGIMEESSSFYDMVTARISYLNVSSLPEGVEQKKMHLSQPGADIRDTKERCQEVFANPTNRTFARALTQMSPPLAVLRRLYRVGVMVYQAQREELEACGSLESFVAAVG